ncbi:MAG TPA: hypothetical protein VKR60_09315 [Candidatus Sulfotelmatobacter sp.]|nr:hypothetical protein [Candidatus Sulfotelmatobacter sp.]
MYTGTLISDLMAAVERAEQQGARARLMAEEMELERLFELRGSAAQDEQVLVGAA